MISVIDGIQLLSLIDKGLDACRYLQAYGQWEQAAWLAKVITQFHCYGYHKVVTVVTV